MDTAVLIDAALVLLFVLIGGVFAGTEMAIVSLRQAQIQELENGSPRARRTAALVRDPNRFLSAVQIGVTVAGFFSSAYGASAIAPSVAPLLETLGLDPTAASTLALIAMTLVVAFCSLVLGELVPKRLAMQNALAITRIVGPPLAVFGTLMRPMIWLLSATTNAVVRLLGGDPGADREAVSAEEIRSLVHSTEALAEAERSVLADVFDASERTLVEVMTPRTTVEALDDDLTVAEAREAIRSSGFSRFPVTGESIDDVIGFVHVRDLLHAPDPEVTTLAAITRPVPHLPGTVSVLATLNRMRARGDHIAVVVDEYGGTDGIVTLEDLLEELVGEIYDEYDRATGQIGPDASEHHTDEVDGALILEEFEDETGIALPDDGGYETVGGYVMSRLERIAREGDEVPVEGADGVRLRVTAVQERRVRRVRVLREATHE